MLTIEYNDEEGQVWNILIVILNVWIDESVGWINKLGRGIAKKKVKEMYSLR